MKRLALLMILIAIATYLVTVQPPKPVLKKHSINHLGYQWEDPFFYMRDYEDPDTRTYLKAEADYNRKISKDFQPLQKQLFKEMKERIIENDLSVPYQKGDWSYYYETLKGKPYGVYYRSNLKDNKKEIVLDENKLAKGRQFFSLGIYSVSPNQDLLAYSADFEGNEDYTLYIKNVRTGHLFSERISNADEIIWLPDNQSFYYSTHNDEFQTDQVYYHKLGNNISQDLKIYQEKDQAFNVSIYKSSDEKIVFLVSSSKLYSKAWILGWENSLSNLKEIWSLEEKSEFYPDHSGDKFYALTNKNTVDYNYIRFDPDQKDFCEVLFASDSHNQILEVLPFKNHWVINERHDGQKRIRIVEKQSGSEYIPFVENNSLTWSFGVNTDKNTDIVRLEYESYLKPLKVIDFNMENQEIKLLKEYNPRGEYLSEEYEERTVFVEVSDSVRVPLDIICKKDLYRKDMPCLLYCYGSYGDSEDPYFSSVRLSLLNRGWIYAVAHIRGGGELGRKWHDQGKLLNRGNTFDDLIFCAEYLCQDGLTNREKLVINGGSAGGMVMGAVMNKRPDLFKTVVADVPFVDVLNTMMDSTLALTQPEYDEWGNPADSVFFNMIRSYSPYDQVQSKKYPNLLINAGLNDTRVMYWEPLKWMAKLRMNHTGSSLQTLRMKLNEGHSGSGDRYESLNDTAYMYAFIIWSLNQK